MKASTLFLLDIPSPVLNKMIGTWQPLVNCLEFLGRICFKDYPCIPDMLSKASTGLGNIRGKF